MLAIPEININQLVDMSHLTDGRSDAVSPLIAAAANGHRAVVDAILEMRPDVDMELESASGHTALLAAIACSKGRVSRQMSMKMNKR